MAIEEVHVEAIDDFLHTCLYKEIVSSKRADILFWKWQSRLITNAFLAPAVSALLLAFRWGPPHRSSRVNC